MNLQQLYLTNNNCYIAGGSQVIRGIMVHSTGVDNPWLKRYVGPNDGKLGVNSNNNHWNTARPDGRNVCVHAFIGKLANGNIATYNTLPWTMEGWHSGGTANDGYIGFEICEDDTTSKEYFEDVYKEALELTAYLCKLYDITVTNTSVIGHDEGHKLGMASNHADPTRWFARYGKTMNNFRSDVISLLADEDYIQRIVINNRNKVDSITPDNSAPEVIDTSGVTHLMGNDNIVHESTVIPRRVADSGLQPFMPFVEIYVAGHRINFLPPRHIISLEFTRIEDSGSSFILNIFDSNWDELEPIFSNNFTDIQLRYGISTGVKSKTYNVIITDYTLNLKNSGALISIKGVTSGVVDNLSTLTLNTEVLNPTEAVKRICREEGWIVDDANFDPSDDVNFSNQESITLIKEHPITFIKTQLVPIAVRTSDGESGYKFVLNESTSPPTAIFRAMTFKENAHKTYIYMKGLDSPVIDLQLSINGVFGGASFDEISTGIEATFIDPLTKEMQTLSENLESVRITATGEYSHTDPNQKVAVIDAAGASRSQMNAILRYRLKTSRPYKGQLTIVGDPDFELNDVVRIMIITDKGNLHHSSGLYLVLGIVDNISDGIMTTVLEIFKCEDIEEGIEVVNYKTLLK